MISMLGLGVVAATLLLQRHGYHAPGIKTDREVALLSEDEWQDVVNKNARVTGPHAHKALVLYDTTEEGSADVRDNVEFVMKTLSVRTVSLPETAFDQIAANLKNFDDLIVCSSNMQKFQAILPDIEAWVKAGGHLMFTSSPNNDTLDRSWFPLLGIQDTMELGSIDIGSLQVQTDIIAGAQGMDFSSDVITGNVLNPDLTKDCTVHIATADEDKTPLLWEHDFEKGKVIVSNADLMEGKISRGVIASSYCSMYPVYTYPIINAAVYNIDDMPSPRRWATMRMFSNSMDTPSTIFIPMSGCLLCRSWQRIMISAIPHTPLKLTMTMWKGLLIMRKTGSRLPTMPTLS